MTDTKIPIIEKLKNFLAFFSAKKYPSAPPNIIASSIPTTINFGYTLDGLPEVPTWTTTLSGRTINPYIDRTKPINTKNPSTIVFFITLPTIYFHNNLP